jgi:XTP/dITP diphosphohydrolase
VKIKNIFLASANPGKVREFQTAAHAAGIEVKALPGFSRLPACVESGSTFEENARQKAIHYSSHTTELVFADDSGICIDALKGAPGVYSARYAGPGASDAANNQKLLTELRLLENGSASARQVPAQRAAHYVCVIALARQGEILTVVEGRANGAIIDSPRGSSGFGYDPYFFYAPLGKTFAELSAKEKFAVSHRGEAFRKLLEYLCGWFATAR